MVCSYVPAWPTSLYIKMNTKQEKEMKTKYCWKSKTRLSENGEVKLMTLKKGADKRCICKKEQKIGIDWGRERENTHTLSYKMRKKYCRLVFSPVCTTRLSFAHSGSYIENIKCTHRSSVCLSLFPLKRALRRGCGYLPFAFHIFLLFATDASARAHSCASLSWVCVLSCAFPFVT